jgi:hypothetical protein
MKHGEGFVESSSNPPHRIQNVARRSKVIPVGGAPSRSGFLATPSDASSRRTFSAADTVSREKRCRVGRLVSHFDVRERKKRIAAREPEGDQEN